MVFDTRRTYLCYNNRNLIRDGFIRTVIEKEYIPVDTFNISRLKNPPKGVNYIVTRDPDTREITAVRERRKLLPASKIKVEIDFSKVMKNAVVHPIAPGDLDFSPIASMIATPLLAPLGMGGITSGLSDITFHLLDAEQKINYPFIVTQEIIDTGIVTFDNFPLSVYGIVKQHIVTEEEDPENAGKFVGLNFAPEQLQILGKFSDGVWKGSRRKRIDGATDSDGLFGGAGDEDVKFEDVKFEDQEQLFVKIVKDNRTLKFRGDNPDASGGKDYPFKTTGSIRIDATDTQIRIKTDDLILGETLYITYQYAIERHVRQNLTHKGTIAQGNTIGIVGFVGAIGSEVWAWDYQVYEWKVPVLPTGITITTIDEIEDFYNSDSDYKLSLSEYVFARDKEDDEEDVSDLVDAIEGWRLSESITDRVEKFWAADHRGILFFDDKKITNIYPRFLIRDQEWFTNYLESLPFTSPTGPNDTDGNPTYLPSDLVVDIEDEIDIDREPGFLFDLSEVVNSMLFDREKYPYYRPFAEALKLINKYDAEDDESGIGVAHLDLLAISGSETLDLSEYDLSYIIFRNANAQPLKSYSCEEPFEIHGHHYWSESYDTSTNTGGPGAWYDAGFIDQQVFEWRPAGGSIESYWKLETPYFCGNYTRKSRVYIERMGGNSLDNYSWIYVDTDPFVPHNISLDSNHFLGASTLVFNDDHMHFSLCYHRMHDYYFQSVLPSLSIDESKSHVKEPYNHDNSLVVGQNRILGDSPSYSNGIPITDEVIRICRDDLELEFWENEYLYNIENSPVSDYGLDFTDETPKATIASDWFIKELTFNYTYPEKGIISDEREVSFYFEETESSVGNYIMTQNKKEDQTEKMAISFRYYYGGPLQFLGEFWKKVNIISVRARYTSINDPNNVSGLDLKDYKVDSGQSATIYDGLGRLLIFYSNSLTGNIDIAVSYDDGDEWTIHKSIIRLIEGEFASLPFVIKDFNSNYVHLFYVLNDAFLMYMRIDIGLLVTDDAFVEGKVPSSYNVGDYDQSLENPEKEYWGDYSGRGLSLRSAPSYFIAGSKEDLFFTDQLEIRNQLNLDNQNISEEKKRQTPRFQFSGNTDDMEDEFKGEPYAVDLDSIGVLRLYITTNGKLSVKRTNNFYNWSYDIKEQLIHKVYKDEKLNKGLTEEIHNIQIVRNDYNASITSMLYFYNGMLFIRHFFSNLLFPTYDADGNKYDAQMKDHLQLIPETIHKPIFLVGNVPEDIRNLKVKELEDGVKNADSALYWQFSYSKEMIAKFDERFAVDSDTQVYAYTTTTGLIRIFYKDSFDNLNGIILDGLDKPRLEVMDTLKGGT